MDNITIEEQIDETIEKKFRDRKIESKVIAFILRKDFNIAYSFPMECFNIEPYQIMYKVAKQNKMLYSSDILWKFLKKEISQDEYEIYKESVRRVFSEKLTKVNHKSVDKLIDELKKLYESRVLMKSIGKVINNIEEFDLIEAREILRKGVHTNLSTSKRFYGEFLEDFEQRQQIIKNKQENPVKFTGIPTGIQIFDDLSGGLSRTEIGIVIAKTGHGKSIALGNFALNAWKYNFNVLFVSLEMSKEQVEFRMDSRVTKILHNKFRSGELTQKEMKSWENKIKSLRKRKENYLEVISLPRGCCARDIEEEAMKVQTKRKKEVDLIIVDYLNLMRSNDSRGSKKGWEHQAEVAWNLKELSMDMNDIGVAVWSANQVTDEAFKAKVIDVQHMKYARAISEVAPVIVSLNQSVDDAFANELKLWIIKCRDFEKIKRPITLHPKFNIMALDYEVRKFDELAIDKKIPVNK